MYGINQLYDLAMAAAEEVVKSRTTWAAILVGLGLFFAILAATRWIGLRALSVGLITATLIGSIGFGGVYSTIGGKVDTIGHEVSNIAINDGVAVARKAQSTELQYIHAAVTGFGITEQPCHRTVNSHDVCSSNTPYYDHREINPHPVKTGESCDSKGKNCTPIYTTEYDDEYTPWFSKVVRYYIIPDTKTKYLHSGVYQMESASPDSRPTVYLHNDWRAPEDAAANTYDGQGLSPYWQFNNHVPEFWQRVNTAATSQGTVVVATFVGTYFHWGFGAKDPQYQIYDGHYIELKQIVSLPGPSGATANFTNSYGKPDTMRTLLSGKDGDGAWDFAAVSQVGLNLSQETMSALNDKALEFQGKAGPEKEASFRWFLVADSITQRLGGIVNTTQAFLAYLDDDSVWGHFKLPKNQVIIVISVKDDGSAIVARGMETGMPVGNVLVKQEVRQSIQPGESLPFTVENIFGSFQDHYVIDGNSLKYTFSDMKSAGGVLGILYKETPGWTPPDPNSSECTTAPAEHYGFIRYQMCTQEYLKSTIQVNEQGKDLIVQAVKDNAAARTPLTWAIVIFVLAALFGLFTLYIENQNR